METEKELTKEQLENMGVGMEDLPDVPYRIKEAQEGYEFEIFQNGKWDTLLFDNNGENVEEDYRQVAGAIAKKLHLKIFWKCQNCHKTIQERIDVAIVDVNGFVFCSDQCICDYFGIKNPGPEELPNKLDIKLSGTYYHSMDKEIQEAINQTKKKESD